MTVRMEIKGLAELQRKLASFPSVYRRHARSAMERSVALLQHDLAEYPAQIRGRKAHFVSDKQRKAFFAMLRAGKITVPYRRTGTLGRRWTTRVTERGSVIEGRVGNNTAYAPLAQGPEGVQSREMAARRWPRVDAVLKKNRGIIERYFRDAAAAMARDLSGR